MFDWLKQRLIDIVKWFGDLTVDIFKALWDVIKDAFAWIIDQMLSLAVTAVNAVDIGALASYKNSWNNLGSDIINVLGLLGAGEAAAIIVSAIGVRLVLQLIPFTRLGS